MITVTNRIGAPYTLIDASGARVTLPAHGSVDIDLAERDIVMIRASRIFELSDADTPQPVKRRGRPPKNGIR